MKQQKIEALHEFHDAQYAKEWAERFQTKGERYQLFELMLKEIHALGKKGLSILEIGIGPGFLAQHLLKNMPGISYEGLDFSDAMLKIAAARTHEYASRVTFTHADLIQEEWAKKLQSKPEVIVSTWALHDLFSKENIGSVYTTVYEVLSPGGLFLNGDFIKPEASNFEYEGGRIKPSEHLNLLKKSNFPGAECVEKFEISIEHPTTSNNYACFKAIK